MEKDTNINITPELLTELLSNDNIKIPNEKGEYETIPLPKGSLKLVQSFLELEQQEIDLDNSITTLQKQKDYVRNARKLNSYKIMSMIRSHAINQNNLSHDAKATKKLNNNGKTEDEKKKENQSPKEIEKQVDSEKKVKSKSNN